MTQGSNSSHRCSRVPPPEGGMTGWDDEPFDGLGHGARSEAPRPTESVDPLTRQLRDIYGAVAEEPIPEAIATLLEHLKTN